MEALGNLLILDVFLYNGEKYIKLCNAMHEDNSMRLSDHSIFTLSNVAMVKVIGKLNYSEPKVIAEHANPYDIIKWKDRTAIKLGHRYIELKGGCELNIYENDEIQIIKNVKDAL